MIGFGVGCFHFGVKKEPPFEFKGLEYISKLEETLNSIQGIYEVNIDIENEFMEISMDIKEKIPHISEAEEIFPNSLIGDIEFKLHIPFEEQKKLLNPCGWHFELFTETFNVFMVFGVDLPVTYIQPINPNREYEPYDSVIIVREFLRKEFEKSKLDYIKFEWVLPTPFFANFFTKSNKHNDIPFSGFTSKIEYKQAVNNIIFCHELDENDDFEGIQKHLFDLIREELEFFYSINRSNSLKIKKWNNIANLLDEIIKLEQENMKVHIKNIFKRPKLLNKAFIALAKFESDELSHKNRIQNRYNTIYPGSNRFLQPLIDKEIEEKFTYPTEQLNRLIKFFESRRLKNIEISIMLISGFIGGIAGAIVTGFFK